MHVVTLTLAKFTNFLSVSLKLDEPRIGMIQEYLLEGYNDTHVRSYYDYMVDVAKALGADNATALKEMKEALDFEIDLAKAMMPRVDRRNLTIILNRLTIEQVQQRFPYINWLDFLNGLMPDKVQVTKDEIISISSLEYLRNLEKLLKTTPKR